MKKDKNYLTPDCQIIELSAGSGFAASTELSNSGIKKWESSVGDDDWFQAN